MSAIYFAAGVVAICSLYLLWDVAWKSLALDMLRERIFTLRFELFEMGQSGELDFEGDLYRSLETLFCGILRFAYRFTLLSYVSFRVEQERAKKSNEFEDLGQQLSLKISRLSGSNQIKLEGILKRLHTTLVFYMAATSLTFMLFSAVYSVLQAANFVKRISKRQISEVIEQEAYRAESCRTRISATQPA